MTGVASHASGADEDFASDYRLVARHVTQAYREAGTILVDQEPRFRVFAETDRQSSGVDAYFGLPCFR